MRITTLSSAKVIIIKSGKSYELLYLYCVDLSILGFFLRNSLVNSPNRKTCILIIFITLACFSRCATSSIFYIYPLTWFVDNINLNHQFNKDYLISECNFDEIKTCVISISFSPPLNSFLLNNKWIESLKRNIYSK